MVVQALAELKERELIDPNAPDCPRRSGKRFARCLA